MTHKEILDELRQPVRDLRERIPAVFEGYGAMHAGAFADGGARHQDQGTDRPRRRRCQTVRRLLYRVARPGCCPAAAPPRTRSAEALGPVRGSRWTAGRARCTPARRFAAFQEFAAANESRCGTGQRGACRNLPPPSWPERDKMSGPITTDDTGPIGGASVVKTPTLEITESRVSQVGAFSRATRLAHRTRRTVGAWCFLDHMGPTTVDEHHGLDIGPHPHIGLQTVTWLLDGAALIQRFPRHRAGDRARAAQPHDRRTRRRPLEEATGSYRGLCTASSSGWHNQRRPGTASGVRTPRRATPFALDNAVVTILIGNLDDVESPARRDTDHAGFELDLHPGAMTMPLRADYEHALVVLDGHTVIDGALVAPGHLAYLGVEHDELHLTTDTRTSGDAHRWHPEPRTPPDVVELRRPHPRRDRRRPRRLDHGQRTLRPRGFAAARIDTAPPPWTGTDR